MEELSHQEPCLMVNAQGYNLLLSVMWDYDALRGLLDDVGSTVHVYAQ